MHCCAGLRHASNLSHRSRTRVPCFPPPTPSLPSRLSRSTRLSSLGHPAASRSLSIIFYIWYCIYFKILSQFSSPSPTPAVSAVLHVWICLFVYLLKSLGHTASYVGSSFQEQGSNPHPLHWQCKVLTTGLPGKSQGYFAF